MAASTDPFDRAVEHERALRKRAEEMESPSASLRMITRWFGVMSVAWATILAGHWLLLSDPRWLVVLHTVVFAVLVTMWSFAALFVTRMTKRREQVLGEG